MGVFIISLGLFFCIYEMYKTSQEEKIEREREGHTLPSKYKIYQLITLDEDKEIFLIPNSISFSCKQAYLIRDIIIKTNNLKTKLMNKFEEYELIDNEISTIIHSSEVLEDYDMQELIYKIDSLKRELSNTRIQLLNEDLLTIQKVKDAFYYLSTSKVCVVNGLKKTDFFTKDVPYELKLFDYKYRPLILFLNDFYFCLFSNVILVFDKNGAFSIALDPSALEINLKINTAYASVQNGVVTYPDYVDSDSKCIHTGESETTWLYTTYNGMRDARHSFNPEITKRTDVYEYYTITIRIQEIKVSFIVSSEKAKSTFEKIIGVYNKRNIQPHDPIPELLSLLDNVSGENNDEIRNLIEKYENYTNEKNYFCKEVTI
ncbi:MAG: hypothetical protein LUG60_00065 [Erysipelotrichaceae bacterium]|nr:hypothetical protein [Erysipelotrichaceae bacterium]